MRTGFSFRLDILSSAVSLPWREQRASVPRERFVTDERRRGRRRRRRMQWWRSGVPASGRGVDGRR
jgi:hypothetical protein